MQVRHTLTIEGEDNVHTFEALNGEGIYTPLERVYTDQEAVGFLVNKVDGFGFSKERAERLVAFA